MLFESAYTFLSEKLIPNRYSINYIMANNSMSSSSSPSFYEPPVDFSEEKITLLYHQLKMNLQDIQNVAEEFNDNMKTINKNANISSQLIAAIQDKISGENADISED